MTSATASKILPTVVVKRVVHADPQAVFDAFTKPELMRQWLNPGGDKSITTNELRVGGKYSHEMFVRAAEADCPGGTPLGDGTIKYPHHGEYLEISPPNRLVFTWNSCAVTNTRVTVDIHSVDTGTEVVLTHELLPNDSERRSHTEGWQACLEKLATFVG